MDVVLPQGGQVPGLQLLVPLGPVEPLEHHVVGGGRGGARSLQLHLREKYLKIQVRCRQNTFGTQRFYDRPFKKTNFTKKMSVTGPHHSRVLTYLSVPAGFLLHLKLCLDPVAVEVTSSLVSPVSGLAEVGARVWEHGLRLRLRRLQLDARR